MFENNELIFGIFFLIVGLVFLYIVIKEDILSSDKDDLWGGSMFLQGIVGGLTFIIIGVILLSMHF